MEFVIVLFPEARQVFVDDTPQGTTGATQAVENGFHKFDLGEPLNYVPGQQIVKVTGTTPTSPMPINFDMAVALAEPPAPRGMPESAIARAAKKRGRPRRAAARKKRPARARSARTSARSRTSARTRSAGSSRKSAGTRTTGSARKSEARRKSVATRSRKRTTRTTRRGSSRKKR